MQNAKTIGWFLMESVNSPSLIILDLNKGLKFMNSYFRFLREHVFCNKNFKTIALACIVVFLTSCLSFMTPVISKLIIDSVATHPNINLLNTIGFVALFIVLCSTTTGMIQNTISNRLTQRIGLDVRHRYFSHIQGLSWDFFDRYKPGELQYRMFNDITTLAENASMLPVNLVFSLIVLIIANLEMFYLNWKVAMFVNLVLIINGTIFFLLQSRIKIYASEVQKTAEDVYGTTQEQINHFKLAQLSCASSSERRKTYSILRKLADKVAQKNIFVANSGVAIGTVSSIWSIGILWIGGYNVILKTITLGDLTAFLSITGLLIPVSTGLVSMFIQYPIIKVSISRFYEILNEVPEITNFRGSLPWVIEKGRISFRNVSFVFSNSEKQLFTNINIEISSGCFAVISGPSGIGKSTFLRLLARLYDPKEGVIEIDGVDLKNISLLSLRRQLGYVGGYSTVFTGTVFDNITYGLRNKGLDQVIQAAKLACIHERISALPDGYFTFIGTRGFELSDGEIQRIGISRCFLANPKIWLMDEATANLDRLTEERIIKNIQSVQGGSTVLMVSHREEVYKFADVIFDISNWRSQDINQLGVEVPC